MTSATSPPESGAFSFEVRPPDAFASAGSPSPKPIAFEAPLPDVLSFELAPPKTSAFAPPPDALSFEPRRPDASAFEPSSPGTLSFEQPLPDTLSFEPPPPDSDRRVRLREVIRVQARICLDDEPPLEVHTIDLSSHGLAITSTRPLNVGLECSVELGISAPELACPPALRASVRYCARLQDDQFRIGMKFTAVSVEAAELIVAVLEL